MSNLSFSIVVAASSDCLGIGINGDLPWRIKGDMDYFKKITTETSNVTKRNVVIMGRKTWESIPYKFRPLVNRINVVISRNERIRDILSITDEVISAQSLTAALEAVSNLPDVENIYVIGGGTIYAEAIVLPQCRRIYLTEVHIQNASFDTFFPEISARKFQLLKKTDYYSGQAENIRYRFMVYEMYDDEFKTKIIDTPTAILNIEEQSYIDIVKDIIEHGVLRGDRTGTGTLSKFGVQMRFSLRDDTFPLLTTKKVFWRGVAEELLWFVEGNTNANTLREKGIHIWDGNGSKEFLSKLGFHDREEGDLGPVYGFQWRHFGAKYEDMHTDYTGHGIDQLKQCIHTIKTNPEDRRIILTAWNPSDLKLMALPPCHMFCQFFVANNELSCQMYQRSADMGLGVPFNIASYALLTRIVAQVCNLKAGDFVHSIGDAHVYLNHVDALKEQITRTPREFPKLVINNDVHDIDGFQFSDFSIEGYNPYPTIHMKMAV